MPERGLFVHPNADGAGTSPQAARKAVAGLLAPVGALGGRPGVLSGMVVSGTAGWSYSVGAGHIATPAGTGELVVWANASAASASTSPAPGTGSRIDIVWARHSRRGEGDTVSEPEFGVAQGTATTGTPTPPSIPADALEVGRATVPSGATGTSGATFSTASVQHTASRGAAIPVADAAQQNAITWGSLATPALVWRRDTGQLRLNRGDGWRTIAQGAWTTYTPALGGSPAPIVGTSGTRVGEYSVVDHTVTVRFDITFGSVASGMQVGGGNYTMALPLPAAATGISRVYGFAHASDNGTGGEMFAVRSSASDSGVVTFVRVSSAQSIVSSSSPWVWAEGDSIRGTFTYQAA